ncbi:hypothetical protein E2C01_022192 [Portunus trituberculatus]|uniref:Uncharacterized protein n=1 Tax=Portunus trituberculatus TaxID=210409 RepID=A0A5B7E6Z0_PORTR|nr:hypothetical protein [Portunus trituberculatus]
MSGRPSHPSPQHPSPHPCTPAAPPTSPILYSPLHHSLLFTQHPHLPQHPLPYPSTSIILLSTSLPFLSPSFISYFLYSSLHSSHLYFSLDVAPHLAFHLHCPSTSA